MQFSYKTKGTCSQMINIDIDESAKTINKVEFIGGCSGNTKGIAALVKDMPVDEVIARLSGIRCGFKSTSCPDQLAAALTAVKEKL